jgi:hypothetical protein
MATPHEQLDKHSASLKLHCSLLQIGVTATQSEATMHLLISPLVVTALLWQSESCGYVQPFGQKPSPPIQDTCCSFWENIIIKAAKQATITNKPIATLRFMLSLFCHRDISYSFRCFCVDVPCKPKRRRIDSYLLLDCHSKHSFQLSLHEVLPY